MTKITAEHLVRSACVYIRQSTADQLAHNHESRRRQYGLVDRAKQLGWSNVDVIDDDLGRSGGGIARPGFERLLATICDGRVGAVLAIEASRQPPPLFRLLRRWRRPSVAINSAGIHLIGEVSSLSRLARTSPLSGSPSGRAQTSKIGDRPIKGVGGRPSSTTPPTYSIARTNARQRAHALTWPVILAYSPSLSVPIAIAASSTSEGCSRINRPLPIPSSRRRSALIEFMSYNEKTGCSDH